MAEVYEELAENEGDRGHPPVAPTVLVDLYTEMWQRLNDETPDGYVPTVSEVEEQLAILKEIV